MAVKNFHFCQADGGLISNALYGVDAGEVLTRIAETQCPALKQKIPMSMRVSVCPSWSVKVGTDGHYGVGFNIPS